MAFDGSGTFNRVHDWTDDRDASVNITASRVDAEADGFATGLTNCITKDGQTNPTANLKMNSNKHTGVAAGTALTDYADVASVQKSSYLYALASGSPTVYVVTLSPVPAAYTTGMTVIFKVGSGDTNTGACTINVNSLGAKSIKTPDGSDPEAGAMIAGQIAVIVYDGTNFQLVSVPSEMQISEFATTTEMVFHQASAPTGWTKSADNDQVLRVVSGGTGGSGSGGTASIVDGTSTSAAGGSHVHAVGSLVNAAESSHTHTGPSHTHTGPSHTHAVSATTSGPSTTGNAESGSATTLAFNNHTHTISVTSGAGGTGATGASGTGATGAGSSHNHAISGSTAAEASHTHVVTPAIKYRDVIICAKD
jgi:ribosomal protein S19